MRSSPNTVSGISLVLTLFVGLAFLPDLLRKRTFQYKPAPSNDSGIKLPIDHKFVPLANVTAKSPVSVRELAKNRKVLVNLWATWCAPCVEEFPRLEFLNRQLESLDGPVLVTIAVDDTSRDIEQFFQTLEFKPTLIVLHDPQGNFSRSIGTTRFPETFLINNTGLLEKKWIGPQDWLSEPVLLALKNR